MHDELMIANSKLRKHTGQNEATLSFDVRLPWYRSLPTSCVEDMTFEIDGHVLPRSSVTLMVNGIRFDLAGIGQLGDAQWFVLDTIEVLAALPEALSAGFHHVKLITRLRIPYKDDSYKETEYIQFAVCEKRLEMEVS